jgi:hypothetical protein
MSAAFELCFDGLVMSHGVSGSGLVWSWSIKTKLKRRGHNDRGKKGYGKTNESLVGVFALDVPRRLSFVLMGWLCPMASLGLVWSGHGLTFPSNKSACSR